MITIKLSHLTDNPHPHMHFQLTNLIPRTGLAKSSSFQIKKAK